MRDLTETVRHIVERSFPRLLQIDMSCQLVERADDFIAGIQWRRSTPPGFILSFSTEDAERMPEAALTGCIVHELCHAEHDLELPDPVFAANDHRYASDPAYRSAHEREIDLAVVQKGYWLELLALQAYHNEHYEAYGPSDGLTPEEIRIANCRITDK